MIRSISMVDQPQENDRIVIDLKAYALRACANPTAALELQIPDVDLGSDSPAYLTYKYNGNTLVTLPQSSYHDDEAGWWKKRITGFGVDIFFENQCSCDALVRNVAESVMYFDDETLEPGQDLENANGLFRMVMQPDGNLVTYDKRIGKAIWATNTAGHHGAYAKFSKDGNFYILKETGGVTQTLWSSTEWTHGRGYYVAIRDGGHFQVIDKACAFVYNFKWW